MTLQSLESSQSRRYLESSSSSGGITYLWLTPALITRRRLSPFVISQATVNSKNPCRSPSRTISSSFSIARRHSLPSGVVQIWLSKRSFAVRPCCSTLIPSIAVTQLRPLPKFRYALNPFDCNAFKISVTSASVFDVLIVTREGRLTSTTILPSAMLIATSPVDFCDTSQRSW